MGDSMIGRVVWYEYNGDPPKLAICCKVPLNGHERTMGWWVWVMLDGFIHEKRIEKIPRECSEHKDLLFRSESPIGPPHMNMTVKRLDSEKAESWLRSVDCNRKSFVRSHEAEK